MALVPGNPLVGGTVLRRAAVESPDFVHGVSGWSINQDGSAEFHDIILPDGQGISVYFASSAPVTTHIGDLWYDTSNGLLLHRWDGTSWVAESISTGAIAAGAITNALLASGAVGTSNIQDAAITNALLATAAVAAANIEDGAITTTQIAAAAAILGSQLSATAGILGSQLSASAGILGSQLAAAAGITSGQVSFTARDIGGITTTIAASAPASPKAGDLWFDSSNGYKLNQYSGSAWTAYQYGTNAIAAGSVTAALIAANTITAAQIASGTITATQIASGTITSSLIAANAIVAGLVAAGAIDGFTINGLTINGDTINAADVNIDAGAGNALFAYGNALPRIRATFSNFQETLGSGSVTSALFSPSVATVAGDALLLTLTLSGTATITGVTDSAGNTWSLIQSESSGNIYQFIALNTTALTTSDTITASFSASAASQSFSVIALDCSGIATASAVDKTATGGGTKPISLSTGTLSQAPELAIGSWTTGGAALPVLDDSVFTDSSVGGAGGGVATFAAYLNSTTSVTNTVTAPYLFSDVYGCLVTLKGSSAAQVLSAAIAAISGTDPIASTTYPAGISSFATSRSTLHTNLNAAVLEFIDTVYAAQSPSYIGLATYTNSNDSLWLSAPAALSTDAQPFLYLQRVPTPGPGLIRADDCTLVIDGGDLRVYGNVYPLVSASPEAWHYVGNSGEPAFGSGWSNRGSGWVPLAYRKLASPANSVQIKGWVSVAATSDTLMFTLPTGYQPTNINSVWLVGASTTQFNINSSGQVACASASLTTGHYYIDTIIDLDQ